MARIETTLTAATQQRVREFLARISILHPVSNGDAGPAWVRSEGALRRVICIGGEDPSVKASASLSDLFAALERAAAGLPPDQVPALLGELERLRANLWGRVTSPQPRDNAHSTPQGIDDRLLTIPEVAELLTMHVSSLYEMTRRGVLPSVRVGKHVRVRATALRQWLVQREHVGYSAQPRGRSVKPTGMTKRSA